MCTRLHLLLQVLPHEHEQNLSTDASAAQGAAGRGNAGAATAATANTPHTHEHKNMVSSHQNRAPRRDTGGGRPAARRHAPGTHLAERFGAAGSVYGSRSGASRVLVPSDKFLSILYKFAQCSTPNDAQSRGMTPQDPLVARVLLTSEILPLFSPHLVCTATSCSRSSILMPGITTFGELFFMSFLPSVQRRQEFSWAV